ncbi:MAG: hypothetical protein Q9227_007654 [Pyrenula ochraceoflavens]
MASQAPSRKRPAPGTSPASFQQYQSLPGYAPVTSSLSNDQFLQWGQNMQDNRNSVSGDNSAYPAQSYEDGQVQQSGPLTRRSMDQQLVNRSRGYNEPSGVQWVDQNRNAVQANAVQANEPGYSDDVQELERRAQIAKKEATTKRKQIPPFIQKLSSFLEDPKNFDFIRWSEDGKSFIVLDEDEFAKRLIPELFKHNNYASFVRQLNMYGFHKKVGLSDNSMKAAENKHKSPSEYSNPYFRRGHPDLLWLIQKPKNPPGQGKQGKRGKADSEQNDEEINEEFEDPSGSLQAPDGRPKPKAQLAIGQGEQSLPADQLAGVHRELQAIRSQQQAISNMIRQLKREHENLYGQAATFQEQHSRHENSIHAILTFLATFFRGNLQASEGAQSIANMFSGSIDHEQPTPSVVDVGDFQFDDPASQRSFKKQPLLLAPPDSAQTNQPGSVSQTPASPYRGPQTRRQSQSLKPDPYRSGNVEELLDSTLGSNQTSPTTPVPQSATGQSPQRDILSMIQNSNARNSPANTSAPEFSNVLGDLQNSNSRGSITPSQRADVLRLINNSANPGSKDTNNALVSPNPPPMPNNYDMRLADAKADFDRLAEMQADQDRSVQNLTNLLQPLSPTGSIPGIGDGSTVQPPPLDLDQFINYFPSDPAYDFNGGGNDANQNYFDNDDLTGQTSNGFGLDDFGNNEEPLFGNVDVQPADEGYEGVDAHNKDGTVHGRVESMTSSEAPSPAAAHDVDAGQHLFKGARDDIGERSPAKRQKRG